ncbi:hypothetical protein ABIA39_009065 [Nocardia sp. GAS34]
MRLHENRCCRTGVTPRGAQVALTGTAGRICFRLGSRSTRLGAERFFYARPLVLAPRDRFVVALDRPPRWTLPTPAQPLSQDRPGLRNTASTSAICSSSSRGRRPTRSAPTRASRPLSVHALCQREAVCADTSSSTTTSTCRLPASNISTARIRRSRNASKSRRAADHFRFRPRSRPADGGIRSNTPRLSYTTAQSERNNSLSCRKIFNTRDHHQRLATIWGQPAEGCLA